MASQNMELITFDDDNNEIIEKDVDK